MNSFGQPSNEFRSSTSTTIIISTTTNACTPNPCNNGGLCTTSNGIIFTCFCLKGYSGMCLD